MSLEPIESIIARSSLGKRNVRRKAMRTSEARAHEIMKKAGFIKESRDFSSPPEHKSPAGTPNKSTSAQIGGPAVAGRRTSPKAAKAASKVLRDGRTSNASKTAAASALSQRSVGSKKGGKK